jgi:hypothetical protein
MDDPALGQQLRSGALRLASEYFSWSRAVDHTIDALSGNDFDPGQARAVST